MLSIILSLTQCAGSGLSKEPNPPPAVVVQEAVESVQAQVTEHSSKLDAIERYLADREALRAGRTPKNLVQPPLEDYMKPGAPQSFIPGAVEPAAPEPTVTAVQDQDQGPPEPLPIN